MRRHVVEAFCLALLIVLGVVSSGAGGAIRSSASTPKRGGVLTVLLNSEEWPQLDPIGSQAELDGPLMSAVFGELFEAGPNGTIVPDEATAYKFSDHNLQFDITIRAGQKFQDGTPFNAAAVAASMNRDLVPANACTCLADFSNVTAVTAVGQYDVRMKLDQPYAPLLASFIDDPMDWTISPTALSKMGVSAFDQNPVGAGPFEVVSNAASSELVTKRYPGYWEKGHPYLAGIKFLSTTSDQSDVDAIQTGQADLTAVGTPSVWEAAKTTPGLDAYTQESSTIEFVRFNTQVAPFNNPTVREAIMLATNDKAITQALSGGIWTPIEGFTSPYMAFYQKNVPSYPKYNLAKATQLVNQLGGLSFNVYTSTNSPASIQDAEALAGQWEQAGMKVNIVVQPLATAIVTLTNGSWGVLTGGWGGCDIDPGTCAPVSLASDGKWSGLRDPTLDGLLNQAAQFVSPTTRARVYAEINQRLNTNYDVDWGWAQPVLMVASSKVEGLPHYVAVSMGVMDYENVWLK